MPLKYTPNRKQPDFRMPTTYRRKFSSYHRNGLHDKKESFQIPMPTEQTKGRLLNVIGDAIDGIGELDRKRICHRELQNLRFITKDII